MKKIQFAATLIFLTIIAPHGLAESYLLNGGQKSQIHYTLTEEIMPVAGTSRLQLSFVMPQTFTSPTYQQKISDLSLHTEPTPDGREEIEDKRGNRVVTLFWQNPSQTIQAAIEFTAHNQTTLKHMKTTAAFPQKTWPESLAPYLNASEQVQSTLPAIGKKALQLTRTSKSQLDAVQQIIIWTIDHMRYVLRPQKYDAAYAFRTGRGNCQNYSHLAAALMRAVNIPVRIVNGITLKQPYTIPAGQTILTMGMAQGRHSWIEVFFDDLGWVPFDPQQTQFFVSNRFIRVEIGVDNAETNQDGLLRWRVTHSARQRPEFSEEIRAEFISDQVGLTGKRQQWGPRNILLTPSLQSQIKPRILPPQSLIPPAPPADHTLMTKPFRMGNMEFPIGVNFVDHQDINQDANQFQIQRSFMVETAEYVTSQNQYAQIFTLEKSLTLEQISLALHKFGGSGMLWLELRADTNGLPGKSMATSQLLPLDRLPTTPGYHWQAFDFSDEKITLPPGRYWIALGYSGSPIVNWFYSYGKPIGPSDGTRFSPVLTEDWRHQLSFEFNYKVEGRVAP